MILLLLTPSVVRIPQHATVTVTMRRKTAAVTLRPAPRAEVTS